MYEKTVKMIGDEMLLRRLIWLNHGHHNLYGDDGEMQCAQCLIDFKRDSVERISKRFDKMTQAKKQRNLIINERNEKMEKIRAKFKCDEVANRVDGKVVRMSPVTSGGEENEQFFKWTPFGNLEMGTVNPDVEFIPGAEYYLDFTPAE